MWAMCPSCRQLMRSLISCPLTGLLLLFWAWIGLLLQPWRGLLFVGPFGLITECGLVPGRLLIELLAGAISTFFSSSVMSLARITPVWCGTAQIIDHRTLKYKFYAMHAKIWTTFLFPLRFLANHYISFLNIMEKYSTRYDIMLPLHSWSMLR